MSKAEWVVVDVSGKLIIVVDSQINKLTPVIVGRCWQSIILGRCGAGVKNILNYIYFVPKNLIKT